MAEPLHVNSRIVIPAEDLSVETYRSSGPGGQHVNTTDSAVRVRFAVDATSALNYAVKQRLRAAHPSKLTVDGELLVTCSSERSQQRNLETARERLATFIRAALTPPKPRKKTRPSRASKERRLKAKKVRGDVKRGRGKVASDD